jgi:hypothetical protein
MRPSARLHLGREIPNRLRFLKAARNVRFPYRSEGAGAAVG